MMKISIKDLLLTLIFSFLVLGAICYILSLSPPNATWRSRYLFSLYGVSVFSVIYLFQNARVMRLRIPAFLAFFVFYEYVVSSANSMLKFFKMLSDTCAWPLVFLVFYEYSTKRELPRHFKHVAICGYGAIAALSVPIVLSNGTLRIEGVFATFFCFTFLPVVYLVASKRVGVVCSALTALLMLLSLKRSAFIITTVGVALYYFLSGSNENNGRKKLRKRAAFFMMVVCACFVGMYVIEKFNVNIISRLASISEDGGSGRTKIWNIVLQEYNRSLFLQKMFGHGFQAVYYNVKPSGISRFAHNSYLETLYDYGGIGLLLVIILQKHSQYYQKDLK